MTDGTVLVGGLRGRYGAAHITRLILRPRLFFNLLYNLKIMNDWWTAPAESADGRLIMVSGRNDISTFRENPRFSIRINISWRYSDAPDAAMPAEHDAEIMEKATDSLQEVLRRDPVAVMTGIYTGAGEREWVFYTLSTHIFQKKLNEALADLPLLPLAITAENDPEWAEYDEMRQAEIR